MQSVLNAEKNMGIKPHYFDNNCIYDTSVLFQFNACKNIMLHKQITIFSTLLNNSASHSKFTMLSQHSKLFCRHGALDLGFCLT